MKNLTVLYFLVFFGFAFFSYGFVDGNLQRTGIAEFFMDNKALAGGVYVALVLALWGLYWVALRTKKFFLSRWWVVAFLALSLLSFPAFSYDIFNYIATSKLTFLYRENPYLVMPIEIPNEPMLAFTRAANKLALYGPSWILLTGLPHLLGFGNIWATIIATKALVLAGYLGVAYLIFKTTKRAQDVVFFCLNPLVMVEVLVSGHNDVVMMFFALAALTLAAGKKRITGALVWLLSVGIKGATVVLAPLLIFHDPLSQRSMRIAYTLMFGVFLLTPFREEMYPWYALWVVPFAALLGSKERFIRGLTVALTFGLSFRHVHYIVTAEYAGAGPLFRTLVTALPVGLFLLWIHLRKR